MDQSLDGKVEPDEEENLVCPAHQQGNPSTDTSIQETAVNVQWVKAMLN
jgi:hypothetical protein